MKLSIYSLLLTPLLAFGLSATTASAFELKAEKVADGVHALIGPTTARTYENHGLNANFGVIDTAEGTVLIDSGASVEGARLLERQAVALTGKPVRWVINTGVQDHRWLGNGYFRSKGVEVIALTRTVESQQKYGLAQLDSLRPVLKERLDGTEPLSASRKIDGDVARLQLGGRNIELHYFADAHFPSDVVVWLPAERIAF
ncbi:MAG: MBL fold metallo-hydrolase, partial [Betaproteobacteria bacterium HGW-Betaproteobacteria-21]